MSASPAKTRSRSCVGCGGVFDPRHGNQRYCDRSCAAYRPVERTVSRCETCDTPIVDSRPRRYCSPGCESPHRACERCLEPFRDRGTSRFCRWCREDVREEARFRLTVTGWFYCRECSVRVQRKWASDERQFCSNACVGAAGVAGRKKRPARVCTSCGGGWRPTDRPESRAASQCWECRRPKGDATRYSHVREGLRRRLILREGGRCQDCGKSASDVGGTLHAHHVVPQAMGGENVLGNLRLLCPDCHVGSGWWRHHYMLAMAGLVVPPVDAMAA